MALNRLEIQNLQRFLSRAQLAGSEVDAFNACREALARELVAALEAEQTAKKAAPAAGPANQSPPSIPPEAQR